MMSPPSFSSAAETENDSQIPLLNGKLRDEDLKRLADILYEMMIQQLRLENEREGRAR